MMKLSDIALRAEEYAKLTRKNKTATAFFTDLAEMIDRYQATHITQVTSEGYLNQIKFLEAGVRSAEKALAQIRAALTVVDDDFSAAVDKALKEWEDK